MLPSLSSRCFFPTPITPGLSLFFPLCTDSFFSNENLYSIRENIAGGMLSSHLVRSSVPRHDRLCLAIFLSIRLYKTHRDDDSSFPGRILDYLINPFHFTLAVLFCLKLFSVAIKRITWDDDSQHVFVISVPLPNWLGTN